MLKKKPNLCYYHSGNQDILENSLKNMYPFKGDISFYHPLLDLYSKTNLHKKLSVGHTGFVGGTPALHAAARALSRMLIDQKGRQKAPIQDDIVLFGNRPFWSIL